eukprot:5788389-Amphidinium_carterae.1
MPMLISVDLHFLLQTFRNGLYVSGSIQLHPCLLDASSCRLPSSPAASVSKVFKSNISLGTRTRTRAHTHLNTCRAAGQYAILRHSRAQSTPRSNPSAHNSTLCDQCNSSSAVDFAWDSVGKKTSKGKGYLHNDWSFCPLRPGRRLAARGSQ